MNRVEQKPDARISLLIKGADRYIVCFSDRKSAGEALRTLGRWAANPELNITWYDVANWAIRLRATLAEMGAECQGK